MQRRRPELRVIVSSATMDAELFRDFFETYDPDKTARQKTKRSKPSRWGGAAAAATSAAAAAASAAVAASGADSPPDGPTAVIVSVEGRTYPVDVFYSAKPVGCRGGGGL